MSFSTLDVMQLTKISNIYGLPYKLFYFYTIQLSASLLDVNSFSPNLTRTIPLPCQQLFLFHSPPLGLMYGEEFHTLCQNQSLKLSWCFQTNPVQGYITITVCMYLLNEIKRNNLPSYLYNMYRYSISDQHLKKTCSVSFKMPICRSTRYFYSQKQDCRQPGEPAKS